MRCNLNTPEMEALRTGVRIVTAPMKVAMKKTFHITIVNSTDRNLHFVPQKKARGFKKEWQFCKNVKKNSHGTIAFSGRKWSNAGLFRLEGVGDLCLSASCPMFKDDKINAMWVSDPKACWDQMFDSSKKTVLHPSGQFQVVATYREEFVRRYYNFCISALNEDEPP